MLLATLSAIFLLCSFSEAYPASSRQLLPPMPGYVPVYIRNGDTPLEDINLDLAEAFHAIPSGRSAGRNSIMAMRADDGKPGEEVVQPQEEPKENPNADQETKVEEPGKVVNEEKVVEEEGKPEEVKNEVLDDVSGVNDAEVEKKEESNKVEEKGEEAAHIQKIPKVE